MRSVTTCVVLFLSLALSIGAAATSQPSSTAPASPVANGPAATVQNYFSLINRQSRKPALALWDVSAPNTAQVAGDKVDMMLALARLKQAVANRWGPASVFDLQMALIYPDECGSFAETITGDTAVVTVASSDPQSHQADTYPLIRSGGVWLLSASADAPRNDATREQLQQAQATADHLISLIDQAGKDVAAGRCANTNDVLKRVSDGMGAP